VIVRFLREATDEAEEARRRYARRDAELALDFDEAVDEAIGHIKEAPDRWPE